MKCEKCGESIDIGPYGPTNEVSVKKYASDHASSKGCDWPSAHFTKILLEYERSLKSETSKRFTRDE